MAINPIEIPGLRQSPLQPLNPVKYSDHINYFVDVDQTEEAFREFRESFGDPEQWVAQGAVAIAAGGEQSGKSALLNRCAYWLKEKFGETQYSAIIVDLRWVPAVAQQPMSTRMRLVCHHLVSTLWHDRHLSDDSLREQEEPEDILPYLPRMLREDLVVVALLPPTADVADELVEYARLVPERVILLCETPFVDRLDVIADRFNSTRVTPLILKVGKLRPTDGDVFYTKRRGLYPTDADIVEPIDGLLQGLLGIRAMSIGELQRLLYEVYSEVPDLKPPASVTYEIITEHYIRKTNFGGQR